jgi:hypothetical protein
MGSQKMGIKPFKHTACHASVKISDSLLRATLKSVSFSYNSPNIIDLCEAKINA